MSLLVRDIVHNFQNLIDSTLGNLDVAIGSLSSTQCPKGQSLIFLESGMRPNEIQVNDIACIVGNPTQLQNYEYKGVPFISSTNPRLLLAKVSQRFFPDFPKVKPGVIHPTANVGQHCKIDPTAEISAGVFLGDDVVIGKNVFIGPNSVVESDSVLGDFSRLDGLVFIGPRTRIGKSVCIHANTTIGSPGFGYVTDEDKGRHLPISQQGKVVIEDYVTIGSNCSIDRATFDQTTIGEGTKLDNFVHIGHNCTIGRHCLITARFTIAGSSKIGNHFVCGGGATVAGHIEIANNVHLAAFSVVSKSHHKSGPFGGYPLTPLKDFLRWRSLLPRLPEILKRVSKLEKILIKDKNLE